MARNPTVNPIKRKILSIILGEILESPVEILIPTSISDVFSKKNVDKIKAKLIVEAANIPVTHESEEWLDEKEVLIVPRDVALKIAQKRG